MLVIGRYGECGTLRGDALADNCRHCASALSASWRIGLIAESEESAGRVSLARWPGVWTPCQRQCSWPLAGGHGVAITAPAAAVFLYSVVSQVALFAVPKGHHANWISTLALCRVGINLQAQLEAIAGYACLCLLLLLISGHPPDAVPYRSANLAKCITQVRCNFRPTRAKSDQEQAPVAT